MPHREHKPKQNHLLAALPPDEFRTLSSKFEMVLLQAGEILAEPGERLSYLYFPINCSISLYYHMASGESAEIGMIGNEGMFSITSIMSGETLPYQTIIETTGHAIRISIEVLKDESSHAEALQRILLLYAQARLTQMAQATVCGKKHTLEQHLCFHLLLVHDNSLSDDFILTHESMAHMLGVRRECVTKTAGKLRSSGLIDYQWGHIRIIDRAGLEAQCCECYEVVKREFKRLLSYK